MRYRKFSLILTTLFVLITFGVLSFASLNVSLSPTSLSKDYTNPTNGTIENFTLNLTNNYNHSINLTFDKVDLTNGTNKLVLNLKNSSITNLKNGTTFNLNYDITLSNITGTYTGSILIKNTDNTSENETFPITIKINETSTSTETYGIKILGYDNELNMSVDLNQDTSTVYFYLENNGSVPISNIKFYLSDLISGSTRIDGDDFYLNDERLGGTVDVNDIEDTDFVLNPGQVYKIKLKLNIPSDLDIGKYIGTFKVYYTPKDSTEKTKTYDFELSTASTLLNDVYFESYYNYVKNKVLEIDAESGDVLGEYSIDVRNNEDFLVSQLYVKLDGDLEEETSSNYIPASDITFTPSQFDIDSNDDQEISLRISIPSDQPAGTYSGDIDLYDSEGEKLDSIRLTINVIGDVYFTNLTYKNPEAGDKFYLNYCLKNRGSKLEQNVKVYGTLYDVNNEYGDDTEESNTMILNPGDETCGNLEFDIPQDAYEGQHKLEVKLFYDGEEVDKVYSVNILRPLHYLDVESSAIYPSKVSCDDKKVYTSLKLKNLGSTEEDVYVRYYIDNNQVAQTNTKEMDVDDEDTFLHNINVSGLKPGYHTIDEEIVYAGGFLRKHYTLNFLMPNCSKSSSIIIHQMNESTNQTSTNINTQKTFKQKVVDFINGKNKIKIFGKEINEVTLALGVATLFVLFLIVIVILLL